MKKQNYEDWQRQDLIAEIVALQRKLDLKRDEAIIEGTEKERKHLVQIIGQAQDMMKKATESEDYKELIKQAVSIASLSSYDEFLKREREEYSYMMNYYVRTDDIRFNLDNLTKSIDKWNKDFQHRNRPEKRIRSKWWW